MLLKELFEVDPSQITESFRAITGRAPSNWVPTLGFNRALEQCFATWNRPDHEVRPVVWLSGPSGSGKSSFLGAIAEGLPMLRELGANHRLMQMSQRFVDQPPPMVFLGGRQSLERFGIEPLSTSLLRALNQSHGYAVNSVELAALERILADKGQIEAFVKGFQARTNSEWKDAREGDHVLQEDLVKVLASVAGGREAAERLYEQALGMAQLRHTYLLKLLMELADQGPGYCVVLVDDFESLLGGDTKLLREAFSLLNEITLQSNGKIRTIVASTRPLQAMLHELTDAEVSVMAFPVILSSQDALEVLYQRWLHPAAFAKVQLAMLEPSATHPFSQATLAWLDQVLSDIPSVHTIELFHAALKQFADSSAITLLGPAAFSDRLFANLPSTTAKLVRSAMAELEPAQAALLATLAISPLGGKATLTEHDLMQLSQRQLGETVVPSGALQKLEQSGWIRRLETGVALSLPESQQRHATGQVVSLSMRERMRLLAEVLFVSTLGDVQQVQFRNARFYEFNRMCDSHTLGSANHELALTILTQLSPEYDQIDEFHSVLRSAEGGGQAFIKIAPVLDLNERLDQLAALRQSDARAAEGMEIALSADLEKALLAGEAFVAGHAMAIPSESSKRAIDALLLRLIESVHAKVDDLSHAQSDALAMIRVVLGGRELPMAENAEALKLLDRYFETRIGQTMSLNDVVQRYRRRPFGWPDLEIVLLVARLVNHKRLAVRIDGHAARPAESAEAFTNAGLWTRVMVIRAPAGVSDLMLQASELGLHLFSKPLTLDSELALSTQIRRELDSWRVELNTMLTAADASTFAHDAREALGELKRLFAYGNSGEFLGSFCQTADLLRDIHSDLNDLRQARSALGPVHARVRQLLQEMRPNLAALTRDPEAAALIEKLERVQNGLNSAVQADEITEVCDAAAEKNFEFVSSARELAIGKVEAAIGEVSVQLDLLDARDDVRAKILKRLNSLMERVDLENSHAALVGIAEEAATERNTAFDLINQRITAERPAVGDQRLLTVVRPGKFAGNLLIESEADLEPFFEQLRAALRPMLKAGMRIRFE